jgi:hypothetical protein
MTVENKEISESQPEVKTEAAKNTEDLKGSVFIDKRREEAENIAIKENSDHSQEVIEQLLNADEPAKAEDVKSEKSEEGKEVAEDNDPVKRVMSKVQKRIDKEVAKRKTVEEQLEETRQELAEIRSKQNQQVIGNKDDAKSTEPTLEQISAYLKKMREEGNVDEEVRILDYIAERRAKSERKSAMDELDGRAKKNQEAKAKNDKDIQDLLLDYTVKDDSGKTISNDPMNLANMNGILRKTADALFNDPKTKADYSDPDRVMAYRRAVTDAFRTIYQLGLHKQDTSTVEEVTPMKRRQVLVEPTSDGSEETVEVSPSRILSDHEKVLEEVRNRRKYQNARVPVRQ